MRHDPAGLLPGRVWGADYQFPLIDLTLQPGPDGQLSFRPFGTLTERLAEGYREPVLTWKLNEAQDEVEFRCEVPGLPKKDLNVEVSADSVRITGDAKNQKYSAECFPGCTLNPDKANATPGLREWPRGWPRFLGR